MPKILAIDDKQDNLVTISAVLKNSIPDCSVITAQTGTEGIRIAQGELPDTILLDIIMPEMDGFEVCKRLKSDEKTKHIPVIMISAIKTDSQSRVEGLEIGADVFLSKPISESELVSQVNVTLRVKKAEDALHQEKESLDRQVEEQTIKLVKKNKQLNREINKRKLTVEGLAFSQRVLEISNKHTRMAPILKEFVREFEDFTGCDSVGIRILDDEGNIPYQAYVGFSKSFYETESPLSIKSDQCMCINVVKGETDPNLPFYTESGSFYMNGTTRFLGTVSEADKGSTRNTCNKVGYESVALIPIRMGPNNLGLVHLADHRDNMVPLEKVKLVESAAKQLGTAMRRIVSEEALRVSEEKFRSLVETTSDWIWEIDQDAVYTYASPKIKDILGYEPADIIGKHPLDFMPADEAQRIGKILMDISASKEPFNGLENINIHKDGRKVVLETSGVPIVGSDGNLLGYRGIDRDVTENRILYDQLIRSDRLAATGELAASIAHEINSPLQGITSLINSIKRSHKDDHELFEDLDLIKGGFNNIRTIVKKLLDLNSPGKDRKQSMNINGVIEDTVALFRSYLKNNDVKVNLSLSPEIPDITASPQELGSIFMNMINNAVEAMTGVSKSEKRWKARKSIGRKINIDSRQCGDHIVIKVTDTGPGISKEDMAHIFDPFFTKKKKMGIGIGLSLCHRIIADYNGTTSVDNAPEGGAIFTITLPLDKPLEDKGNKI